MHKIPMQFIKDAQLSEGGVYPEEYQSASFRSRVESKEAFFNTQTQQAYFVTSEQALPFGQPQFVVKEYTPEGRIRNACGKLFLVLSEALAEAEQLAQ